MPLVLKLMLVDTDSGARGESAVDLKPDAVRLTRTSFLSTYCAPTLAVAWEAMDKDRIRRGFAAETASTDPAA
jgi:hypothetical protein